MTKTGRGPGARIGRYELGRRLGRGGMGEVWQAELRGPRGFRKPVALKILRKGPSDDAREALFHEARLGALLQHPHVVGVYELGEADGTWYVAMELVEGATVQELAGSGPLSPAAIVTLGLHASAGLAHIHALQIDGARVGLVHRDIKPTNLLVDRSGQVKVADLGIAALRGTGMIAGTPSTMAPEQAAGKPVAASDLWALGVVLYTMATRRRPFGVGPRALVASHKVEERLEEPEFLGPVDEAVPGLAAVLRGCLRLAPADRWPSAEALHDALASLYARPQPGGGLLDLLAVTRPDLELTALQTTPRSAPGNLPPERDAFFGRSTELAEIATHIADGARLLTLLGPGGCGKTRLALAAARQLGGDLHGGAWCVDLSSCRTEEELGACVAQTLNVAMDSTDPAAQVGAALRSLGPAVIVLDNLEQAVAYATSTVGRWIDMAPELRCLCTSRRVLGLRGERTLTVGALAPGDAVALFQARAPRPAETRQVEDLVIDLDGLPLAIELAAARTRVLSPDEVRRQLRERLGVLAGGPRDAPERHRSIEASLDASWELLPPWAGVALAQLSVFAGPFTLEGAEAVVRTPDRWAIDVLQELADHSLLGTQPHRERFDLLGVVRAYAAQRLGPADRSRAEQRHGRFLAQLGSDAALGAGSAGVPDLPDLEAACRRAIARNDGAVAVPTLRAAWSVLARTGPVADAVALAEATLALPTLFGPARWRVALTAGEAWFARGHADQARRHLQAALALARSRPDPRGEALTLARLALVDHRQGRSEDARRTYEAALAAARAVGDRRIEGAVHANLGDLLRIIGDRNGAAHHFAGALALGRASEDRTREATVLGYVGTLRFVEGRLDEARATFEAALALRRQLLEPRAAGEVRGKLGVVLLRLGHLDDALEHLEAAWLASREGGDRRQQAANRINLGLLHARREALDPARAHFEAALELARDIGHDRSEAIALGNLGIVHLDQGRHTAAADHLERAIALARTVGDRRSEGVFQGHQGRLAVARKRPAEARAPLDAGERILRDLGAGHELATLLCIRAEAERSAGDMVAARTALAEASALAAQLASDAELNLRVGRVQALLARAAPPGAQGAPDAL